jgi:hypothetical protein
VKLVFHGTSYDMFDPNECLMDDCEAVEKYLGQLWSKCFDMSTAASEAKIIKAQLWLSMRQHHDPDEVGPLSNLNPKMGEIDYEFTPEEQATIDKAQAEADPTKAVKAAKKPSGSKSPSVAVSEPSA